MEVVKYLRQTRSQGEFERGLVISLRRKYIFFPVSKAANSSLKALLFRCELSGTRISPPEDEHVHRALCSPLLLPYQLEDQFLEEVLTDNKFQKLTVVRNPYDRALSCYLDRIQKPHTRPYRKIAETLGKAEISFRDFLEVALSQDWVDMDIHYRPQAVELALNRISFDLIGRFETLGRDAQRLVAHAYPEMRHQKLGFQSPAATEAASKRAQYYGPEEIRIAQRLYRDDFKSLEYAM